MSLISCKTKLFKIGSWTLVSLPKIASTKLPSRGMVMIEGTINGDFPLQTPLEPDGKGSHWFRIDPSTSEAIGAKAGDTILLAFQPLKNWPEPFIPSDLSEALVEASEAHNLWIKITPMARWDWIRWLRATENPETRSRRIRIACEMLSSGKTRPCCFNRNICTETYVSKSGILLEPN